MLTFADYIEKVKENQNIKSARQVGILLGMSATAITEFSKERAYPSQETVLKLANLAGVSPEQALIDFNLWKTKDKPNARKVWLKLSKMIGCLILATIIYTGDTMANQHIELINASQKSSQFGQPLYIMYNHAYNILYMLNKIELHLQRSISNFLRNYMRNLVIKKQMSRLCQCIAISHTSGNKRSHQR